VTAAPVAVFAFARRELLETTLDALARCDGFEGRRVHVFCDAPPDDGLAPAAEDVARTARRWCRRHRARVVLRQANLGIRNVSEGIGELAANEGAAVSLEEDHVPARGFLAFVDAGVERFAGHEDVFQIAAFTPGIRLAAAPDTFFLPVPMPAGWATWERAWRHFSWECSSAGDVLHDPVRRRTFDLDGSYAASALLERTLAGEFESYFVRWYLAVFLAGGRALCPRETLVFNTGLNSGLHRRPSGRRSRFHNGAWNPEAQPSSWRLPSTTAVDEAVYAQICAGLRARASAGGREAIQSLNTKTSTS
jgi:hypothetical protein